MIAASIGGALSLVDEASRISTVLAVWTLPARSRARHAPSGIDMMTRILSVFVAALFLVACSDVHYSDSETSDVRDFQDDDKGEHPDEPIVE